MFLDTYLEFLLVLSAFQKLTDVLFLRSRECWASPKK